MHSKNIKFITEQKYLLNSFNAKFASEVTLYEECYTFWPGNLLISGVYLRHLSIY